MAPCWVGAGWRRGWNCGYQVESHIFLWCVSQSGPRKQLTPASVVTTGLFHAGLLGLDPVSLWNRSIRSCKEIAWARAACALKMFTEHKQNVLVVTGVIFTIMNDHHFMRIHIQCVMVHVFTIGTDVVDIHYD